MKEYDKGLIRKYESTVLYADGNCKKADTYLLNEHALKISINGRDEISFICTKSNLRELVAGRLYTDGYISKADDIEKIIFSDDEKTAQVTLRSDRCHQEMTEAKSVPDFSLEWIFSLTKKFEKDMPIHDITSCTHSCILSKDEEILFSCEDIGRHNAVDKTVGYGVLTDTDLTKCILFTSGRVPVDMIQKVVNARIPVVVSKSVATKEAIDLAEKHGLKLILKAHTDSIQILDENLRSFLKSL